MLQKRSYESWVGLAVLGTITFGIYLPSHNAGLVGDFGHWVENLRAHSFIYYINHTGCPSFYQFTQMVSWLCYQLVGTSAWGWFVIHALFQTINAFLLYLFLRRLVADAGLRGGDLVALGAGILFCGMPHISEVIVWKPSFHYLLSFLLMFGVLLSTQLFLYTAHRKFCVIAGFLFLLSSFSLEVFYLTPLFTFTLCAFYYKGLNYDKVVFRKSMTAILLPQLILMVAHIIAIKMVYHSVAAQTMPYTQLLAKPPEYIFHLVFLGRFFPDKVRSSVYNFCEQRATLIVFYGIVAILIAGILMRFSRRSNKLKLLSLLFIWITISIAFISFLDFPHLMAIVLDRYTYLTDGMLAMFLAVGISFIRARYVAIGVWIVYTVINIRYALRASMYWRRSGQLIHTLLKTFPNDPSKTVLLLNLPETYGGARMIVGGGDEFKLMYNTLMPQSIHNTVYDVASYNILDVSNGAHVTVINDSVIHVTLNQWGTWWWYYGVGAYSYETSDYKVNMVDEGHWYELTIKNRQQDYLLLFQDGNQWKTVDWNNKNVDQY